MNDMCGLISIQCVMCLLLTRVICDICDHRTVGDPFSSVDQGPQVDADQFNKIMSYIEQGQKVCVLGGETPTQCWSAVHALDFTHMQHGCRCSSISLTTRCCVSNPHPSLSAPPYTNTTSPTMLPHVSIITLCESHRREPSWQQVVVGWAATATTSSRPCSPTSRCAGVPAVHYVLGSLHGS